MNMHSLGIILYTKTAGKHPFEYVRHLGKQVQVGVESIDGRIDLVVASHLPLIDSPSPFVIESLIF